MYAIMVDRGDQYKVEKDLTIKVDKLNLKPEEEISFEEVLLTNQDGDYNIGNPYTGHKVKAIVVRHGRDKKIKVIKFKRRKHHLKWRGHRQDFTIIKILDIQN